MEDDAILRARQAAQSLLSRGLVDPAVQTLLRIGDVDGAATALFQARRFGEAGRVILKGLGVTHASQIPALDAANKKLVGKAAVCFAQANEPQFAVEIYLALGERARAADVLERAGDVVGAARLRAAPGTGPSSGSGQTVMGHAPVLPRSSATAPITLSNAQKLEESGQLGEALQAYLSLKQLGHAARVAKALGRTAEAAELYGEAGMAFDAAGCWMELGDTGKCLDALVRVPRDDARYRKAAVTAIRLANQLGTLDFQLEHFLSKFVSVGPQDQQELEAFYLLSKVYQAHDFVENAKDALQKLLAVSPNYRDAAERFESLEAETRGSAMVFRKIVEEDMGFRGETRDKTAPPPLPDLPDLPDLPPLGAAPPAPSRGTAVVDPRARPPAAASRTPEPPPAAAPPEPPASADALEAMLAVGTTIGGRYRLEKKIGQGGMAAVFKAADLELAETIAIKVFTQVITDEDMLLRFKQELTLSRQLAHPNIVRLYDIGSHHGMRFLTMELLQGSDLRGRMAQGLTPLDAIDFLMQACAGLQVAHDRGVVHRDLKPENFFVTSEGQIKLMDFGIAKGTSSVKLTQAGMMAGTPEYMSPEQVSNFSSVTHASDLYSLGVMAFEMFTGRVPFTAPDLVPLLMMHVNQPPERPRALNPRIPASLEAVILSLLAKKPEGRPKSCTEVAGALRAVRAEIASGAMG